MVAGRCVIGSLPAATSLTVGAVIAVPAPSAASAPAATARGVTGRHAAQAMPGRHSPQPVPRTAPHATAPAVARADIAGCVQLGSAVAGFGPDGVAFPPWLDVRTSTGRLTREIDETGTCLLRHHATYTLIAFPRSGSPNYADRYRIVATPVEEGRS